MSPPMTIDYISDISCPFCAIGLYGLEQAMERVGDVLDIEIRFQPFELDRDMPPEGKTVMDHLDGRYDSTPEQLAAGRDMLRKQAAGVGLDMTMTDESRMYNTFDAHRLLHWSALTGKQLALKRALFESYFTDGANVGDHAVLVAAAEKAGLEGARAREVLEAGAYAMEVRRAENLWITRGVSAVPATIINERFMVSGAQPPETYEKLLRQIAVHAG